MNVIFVICGKTKVDTPVPIEDLYTGLFVREAVAWAKSIGGARRFIFSGGLGVVPFGTVVAPYEAAPRTFGPYSNDGVGFGDVTLPQVTDERVRAMLVEFDIAGEVLVLGGGEYAKIPARAGRGIITVRRPFYDITKAQRGDSRVGWQRNYMRTYWGQVPPRVVASSMFAR